MVSKEVRDANVKESVRNINTAVTMLSGAEWLTVRTSDLTDVMDELSRLQRIEYSLMHAIESKIKKAGEARQVGKQAAEAWEIEDKIHYYIEERKLRQESYLLSLIAEGKEVG